MTVVQSVGAEVTVETSADSPLSSGGVGGACGSSESPPRSIPRLETSTQSVDQNCNTSLSRIAFPKNFPKSIDFFKLKYEQVKT